MDENVTETRQELRDKKKLKMKEMIAKHGKNLASVYKDAILKRLRGGGK